jgi:hypothetical protein
MREEYNFTSGVRDKHHKAMHSGYTITLHKTDRTAVVKNVIPDFERIFYMEKVLWKSMSWSLK